MSGIIDGENVFFGRTLNTEGFTNLEDCVEKGDISSAFPSYGEKRMTFARLGSDIKKNLATKKAKYQAKYEIITAKQAVILAELAKANIAPDQERHMYDTDESCMMFSWKMIEKETDDDNKKLMEQYNEYHYNMSAVKRDLKMIDVLSENLEDKKKYQLDANQIMSLEKGEESESLEKKKYDNNIAKAGKATTVQSSKVKKVMKEFKAGTLNSSSGKKVTSKDQALAIAMSEAGLSKKADPDIYKFFLGEFADLMYVNKDSELKIKKALDVAAMKVTGKNSPKQELGKGKDDKKDNQKFTATSESDDKNYQKHFQALLKKHGYKSINDIPANKKKKFFDEVDASWDGKNEKVEKAVGGAGARGGIVVGRTKSGKPIYASHAKTHKEFTHDDHKDAIEHFGKERSKYKKLNEAEKKQHGKESKTYSDIVSDATNRANQHNSEMMRKKKMATRKTAVGNVIEKARINKAFTSLGVDPMENIYDHLPIVNKDTGEFNTTSKPQVIDAAEVLKSDPEEKSKMVEEFLTDKVGKKRRIHVRTNNQV